MWPFQMLGGISYSLLWLWVLGVIVLGIALAYGIHRAGRLSRSERDRLSARTAMRQQSEDPQK
jgi:predicted RND superfamily exporter protein